MAEDFDEHLVGVSAGDELEFEAEHPDPDEEAPLQFAVTVKEVKEAVLPELNDEWAAESSEFETVEELRAEGIQIWIGHRPDLMQGQNGYVIRSAAVPDDDPELLVFVVLVEEGALAAACDPPEAELQVVSGDHAPLTRASVDLNQAAHCIHERLGVDLEE